MYDLILFVAEASQRNGCNEVCVCVLYCANISKTSFVPALKILFAMMSINTILTKAIFSKFN